MLSTEDEWTTEEEIQVISNLKYPFNSINRCFLKIASFFVYVFKRKNNKKYFSLLAAFPGIARLATCWNK